MGAEVWEGICVLRGLGAGKACHPRGLTGNPLTSPSRTPQGTLGDPQHLNDCRKPSVACSWRPAAQTRASPAGSGGHLCRKAEQGKTERCPAASLASGPRSVRAEPGTPRGRRQGHSGAGLLAHNAPLGPGAGQAARGGTALGPSGLRAGRLSLPEEEERLGSQRERVRARPQAQNQLGARSGR